MPEHVVTIDEIKKQEVGFCKFVAQGKTFNYKYDPEKESRDLAPLFAEGKKLLINYREFEYTKGPAAGKTGRYINSVSKTDAPNSFTASESKRDNYKGGGTKKSDFDPTLSARQTAAHVAGVLTQQTSFDISKDAAATDVYATWQFYADEVVAWLNKRDMVGAAQSELGATVIPDDIDPAYEQASVDADDFWPTEDAPF